MEEVRVDWRELQEFTARVFAKLGMPRADAEKEAEVLVWANLRGVDSHGVQRITQYAKAVDENRMNVRPSIRVERETAATLLIDADRAFGPIVTTFAVEKVIAKARAVGIGWALIRNTTHQGAMAYYALMAAEQGMAGIAVVCSPPNMAPPGAKAAGAHNSPIAVAVPGADRGPICLDMATSVAAMGKLQVAVDKGVSIPETWALDEEGRPTTDPAKATLLQPAGGYKGYGLALIFECLTSLMVGNPLVTSNILQRDPPLPGAQNGFVAAIDIAAFTKLQDYRQNVDLLIETEKGLSKMDGVEELLVPGEPEEQVYRERVEQGIPIPPGTAAKLGEMAARFALQLPRGLG
jgi:LDH2 family malate/lactate/ureidoglycolate dehydrogenase